MKIVLVYKEDYPWDVRIEKLALALNEQGHKVTIVSSNLDQRAPKENNDNFKLFRLPGFKLFPPFVRKLLTLPLWFNPIWLLTIFLAVRAENASVIIVRDLPLVKSALLLKRITGAKVILDMAEVYPEMYASLAQFSKMRLPQRFLKHPKIAELYENSVLPKLDHILVMIEESRDRLEKKGIPEDKMTIVSNTPPIDKFRGVVHQHDGTTIRLVYVGFLTELRGLDILIKAVSHYIKQGNPADSIQLDIIGKGAMKPDLQNLVAQLELSESVTIHGWLSQKRVDDLMIAANVGALTYRVCGHWNSTIPNKIFDYMLAGLPVLATDVIPIRRIVKQVNCGFICRDLDSIDIAEKLARLREPELRKVLGENGHEAVRKIWNWENDKSRLTQALTKTCS